MQVRFMQRVDYYLGIPLCWLMSIIRKVKDLVFSAAKGSSQKILFVELSEMGSAIIAFSAIKKAESLVGKANLYFLIFAKNRESVDLLETIPGANVITIDDSSFIKFAISLISAIFKIRKLGIDTAIDLELFSRCTALICFLCGARIRVGFHNYSEEGLYRGSLFTHEVYYNATQHMALNFLGLVGALSADNTDRPLTKVNFSSELLPSPRLTSTASEIKQVESYLQSVGYSPESGKRLMIVNPDPGLLSLRGWPIENYKSLINELLHQEPDVVVAVIGLAKSRFYYEALSQGLPQDRLLDLTGKTKNLREVIALFDLSKLVLTNDSGPAHMATLSGSSVIVLFGPETPLRYAPLSPRAATFFAGLSCSPCYSAANHRYSVCNNNVCMRAIAVAPVLKKVREMLSERTN